MRLFLCALATVSLLTLPSLVHSRTIGSCNDDTPVNRDPSCDGAVQVVERVEVTGSRGVIEVPSAGWRIDYTGSPQYSGGITRRELAPGSNTRTQPACPRENLAIRSVLSWLRAGENPGKEIVRYRGNMGYPSGPAWGKFSVQFDYRVTQVNNFGVVIGEITGMFQIHYEYNFDSKDYTQPHFGEDFPPSAGCKGQNGV